MIIRKCLLIIFCVLFAVPGLAADGDVVRLGKTNTGDLTIDGDVTANAISATSVETDRTATPGFTFGVSTCTDDDDNAISYVNATATGSGAEIIDWYWRAQGAGGTAGTMATFMDWDGDAQELTVTGDLVVTGAITQEGNTVIDQADPVYQVNLLTNSGFGVWSNSEDLYTTAGAVPAPGDATELITNGQFAAGIGDWDDESTGDGSFAWDTDHAELDANTGTAEMGQTIAGLTTGKLYELEFDVAENCTSLTVTGGTAAYGGTEHFTKEFTSTGASKTVVFEAVGTTIYLQFASTTNEVVSLDDITLHEVTPGIVSATSAGPNGWIKSTSLKIFREHNGTNTKNGSFYALKSDAQAQDNALVWPGDSYNKASFYTKCLGRTLTLGAWVKSSTASDLELLIRDSDSGYTYSDAHTGGGTYEWLEVTKTISTSATSVYIGITHKNASPGTAYISQPMLVFSSSIGSGNFVAPPREIIDFEAAVTLTDYSNDALADAAINLESESLGKIPKGATAVYLNVTGTGSGATDKIEFYKSSSKIIGGVVVNVDGTNPGKGTGWQPCDSNGDIYVDESGTITATTLKIIGVQVN